MPDITLVSPAYFSRFRCKCGACRSVCCAGWRVTLTDKEYFRMQGIPCTPVLRARIDASVRPTLGPDPDEAAYLLPDAEGNCRMRDPDGLCALQKECGETILPAVCRMYPRSVKPGWTTEACCSGSCEGVVELLMDDPASVRLMTETLTTNSAPEAPDPPPEVFRARRDALDAWLSGTDEASSFAALAAFSGVPAPDLAPAAAYARGRRTAEFAVTHSVTLAEYADGLLPPDGSPEAFASASARYAERYPDADAWTRAVLANHLFYMQYPDFGEGRTPDKAFRAFCAAEALLRYSLVLLTDVTQSPGPAARWADVAAAVLRYAEHADSLQSFAFRSAL